MMNDMNENLISNHCHLMGTFQIVTTQGNFVWLSSISEKCYCSLKANCWSFLLLKSFLCNHPPTLHLNTNDRKRLHWQRHKTRLEDRNILFFCDMLYKNSFGNLIWVSFNMILWRLWIQKSPICETDIRCEIQTFDRHTAFFGRS